MTLERFVSRTANSPSLDRVDRARAAASSFRPTAPASNSAPPTADATPLVLKLQGGRAPFRWLANGKPLVEIERRRTATWQPDGAGYSTLTVIDAAGRAASVKVFVE